jgi:hypothetical protein
MLQFHVARTLSQARWQTRSRLSGQSVLFSQQGELFAAYRLHEFQSPVGAVHMRLSIRGVSTDFGQKLFIGLLESDPVLGTCGGRGLGVSIDPETGIVEDVHNGGGVLGYLVGAPQEPAREISLVLEAWLYGRVVIPRIWLGAESLVHPAMLLDPGRTLAALAGGEINHGALPRFDHTELTLRPLDQMMVAHG